MSIPVGIGVGIGIGLTGLVVLDALEKAARGILCLAYPNSNACNDYKTTLEKVCTGITESLKPLLQPQYPNIPILTPVAPVNPFPISTPIAPVNPFPISTPIAPINPFPISTPIAPVDPFPISTPVDISPYYMYTAGRFSSSDPHVAELANDIEIAHGNIVLHINRIVLRADGTRLTDIDIETVNALIEIKSGSMSGIEGQVNVLVNSNIANPNGKPVLVYLGDAETNKQLRRVIESYGALVFGKSKRQALIDLLKP